MLEGCVEMRFLAQSYDLGKVLVIDVGVNAKQSLEYCLGDGLKVLREGHTDLRRKERLVIELILHPRHQVVDVLWRATFDRLFNSLTIGPMVLVFRTR